MKDNDTFEVQTGPTKIQKPQEQRNSSTYFILHLHDFAAESGL